MDGATLQAKVYAGRGKVAQRIGLDYRLYRPISASAPLGNLIGTIKAAFNAGDNNYRNPNLPGDAIWYGDFDGRLTQPGDYLVRVSDGQTYYIAGQQQLLPIVCIDCNRSVHITRQQAPAGVGAIGYGGSVPSNDVDVMGAAAALWPASILLGGRSQASVGLPMDVKNVGWKIMIPSLSGVTLMAGDIVTDDLGRRYSIDGAELSDLGWRITGQEAHT